MRMTLIKWWARSSAFCGMAMLATISYGVTLTPPQNGNLALWLRADAGVVADGNGFVSQWSNQNGNNNNHVVQATAANQPKLETVSSFGFQTNPFPVIRFDGAGDILSLTTGVSLPNNTTGGTVFIVHRASRTSNQSFSLGSNDSNRLSIGIAPTINFNSRFRVGGAGGSSQNSTITSTIPALDTFYINAVVWDGTIGADKLNFGAISPGGAVATANQGDLLTGTFTSTVVNVGHLGFGNTNASSLQGDIAEVLIWNNDLTAEEQVQVGTYLAQKYGLVPVPEPSGIILIAFGATIAGLWRVRRVSA